MFNANLYRILSASTGAGYRIFFSPIATLFCLRVHSFRKKCNSLARLSHSHKKHMYFVCLCCSPIKRATTFKSPQRCQLYFYTVKRYRDVWNLRFLTLWKRLPKTFDKGVFNVKETFDNKLVNSPQIRATCIAARFMNIFLLFQFEYLSGVGLVGYKC